MKTFDLMCGYSWYPAIFVPVLKTIIYGYESWWNEIESPEELKDITTEDIENTWYVRLLKDMMASRKEDGNEGSEENAEG